MIIESILFVILLALVGVSSKPTLNRIGDNFGKYIVHINHHSDSKPDDSH
mgnify:CR=1 FL=1